MSAEFPFMRMRRLRRSPALRALVQEHRLAAEDLVMPLFVRHGEGVERSIPSMPGQAQLSVDVAVERVGALRRRGLASVILFGIPAVKDARGTENFADDGIVQRAVRALKQSYPELVVMTDVCLCEYTDHGHCGLVREGEILNDETLEVLGQVALSHARAGADVVAPSAMMDGQVGAIRYYLDREGFAETPIMAYSAKFASAFYGPFRDAAESPPGFGDRTQYQMPPANRREALRESALDVGEGADILMVKPALPYLDLIRETRDLFDLPLAAYNVSGEYAMLKAAAERGWLDERRAVMELLLGIRRAGADLIISYHTADVLDWL